MVLTATIPKKVEYTVGSPTGASVSADAVKVLIYWFGKSVDQLLAEVQVLKKPGKYR